MSRVPPTSSSPSAESLARPLMIFDGDCSFCRRWIMRWQSLTGDRIDYQPYQHVLHRFPQIPHENFGRAVHLVEPSGAISSGAKAVFRALALARRKRWMGWSYEYVPLF